MHSFLLATCLQLLFALQALTQDLCYFEGGRTIIAQNRLYFMGGTYSFAGTGNITSETSLYWIQLNNTSFPVDGLIKKSFLNTTDSSATQYMGGGAFWTDVNETTLYSIGGYPDNTVEGLPDLNSYDTVYDNWHALPISGGPYNKLDRVQGMYATSSSAGGSKSFLAGGKDWIPGLLTFDSTDPLKPSWTNTTTPDNSNSNNTLPYFWGCTTQYVRFGTQGVLVSVGGYADISNTAQRSMSDIQIYDIATSTWSVVEAKGGTNNIPRPRSEFCSALSAAPDDSSFQLTIYGGWSEGDNYALEDVYVLTMPAFQWIKINDTGNNESALAPHAGRRRHYCNAYNDRQMIVLGGAVLNGDTAFNLSSCNTSYPPIKLLDTTTYQWQTQFPLPDTTYQVPQPVINVVGGGATGGAKPASAWQQGVNAELFGKTIARYDPKHPTPLPTSTAGPSGAASNSTSTANPTPSSSSGSSNNAGAIAGGVVGGVAGLAIIGALLYFLILRRKRSKEDKSQDWQKAELSTDKPLPPIGSEWASPRPSHGMHEVQGDNAEKLNPQEMGGGEGKKVEMEGWRGVEAPANTEVVHELAGGLGRT